MTGARLWVMAVLLAPLAWTAAPAYTLASVVNSATGLSGDFAPNGMVSIYGTDLAYGTQAAGAGPGALPKTLAGVSVFVNGNTANLFYVSPTQINFLIPADLLPGTKTMWVVREGLIGPVLQIILKETSPGLFALSDGSAIATHVDGSLVSGDAPATPGEIVVVYAAGLGRTNPEEDVGRASARAAPILLLSQFSVLLSGATVDPSAVLYAGITPGFAGLYQINLRIPTTTVANPEIRVFIGSQGSASFVRLSVKPPVSLQ